jgi:Ca2+-transporting ATPase
VQIFASVLSSAPRATNDSQPRNRLHRDLSQCADRTTQRPPRRRDEALFGPAQLGLALLQGAGVLVGVFGVYVWSLSHYPEPEARGAAFLAPVVGNLVLALADATSAGGRLFAPHRKIYWIITTAAGGVLTLVLMAPALAGVFKVAPLHLPLLILALGVACVSGGWFGVARSLGGGLTRHGPKAPGLSPT